MQPDKTTASIHQPAGNCQISALKSADCEFQVRKNQIVTVTTDAGPMIGVLREKLIGGIYEVRFEIDGGWVYGAFRLDQINAFHTLKRAMPL